MCPFLGHWYLGWIFFWEKGVAFSRDAWTWRSVFPLWAFCSAKGRILTEKKPKPSMSHLIWDPLKAWLPLPSQNLPIPAVALNEDGVTHLGSWMSL